MTKPYTKEEIGELSKYAGPITDGNIGAALAIAGLLGTALAHGFTIEDSKAIIDAMQRRGWIGSKIWEIYKDRCGENGNAFLFRAFFNDDEMVDRPLLAQIGGSQ